MAYIVNNRTYGYDNVAPGQSKGPELGQLNAEETFVDNITVGNPAPENLENVITSTGGTSVSPADSGTEIP